MVVADKFHLSAEQQFRETGCVQVKGRLVGIGKAHGSLDDILTRKPSHPGYTATVEVAGTRLEMWLPRAADHRIQDLIEGGEVVLTLKLPGATGGMSGYEFDGDRAFYNDGYCRREVTAEEFWRGLPETFRKRLIEVAKATPETEERFEPSFVFLYQIRPELAPAEDDLETAVLRYFPAVRWQGEHLFTSYVIPKGLLPAYIRFLRDTSKDEVPR